MPMWQPPFPFRMSEWPNPRRRAKNASDKGTIKRRICFTGVRFFRKSLDFYILIPLTSN